MTALQSFLQVVAVGCLSANAFVVPSQRTSVGPLWMQGLNPDGSDAWMLRDPQRYNDTPNPPPRRREQILQRYRPEEPQAIRPPTRFDQNDPFVGSPYGTPAARIPTMQQPRVTLQRANVDDWKAQRDQQDAFINGAYGSRGPGRFGLNIQRPEIKGRGSSQDDFVNNPYGSQGRPGSYGHAHEQFINRNYERYQSPDRSHRQQSQHDSFMDNTRGANRMEYQGAPERGPRLERFDPRTESKEQYSQRNRMADGAPKNQFDPNRYQQRQFRSPEQRQYDNDQHRQSGRQNAQQGWMHDPKASSFRASQYGHGNDGW